MTTLQELGVTLQAAVAEKSEAFDAFFAALNAHDSVTKRIVALSGQPSHVTEPLYAEARSTLDKCKREATRAAASERRCVQATKALLDGLHTTINAEATAGRPFADLIGHAVRLAKAHIPGAPFDPEGVALARSSQFLNLMAERELRTAQACVNSLVAERDQATKVLGEIRADLQRLKQTA